MITFIKVKEQAPPRADAFYAPEIEHQAEPMRRFQGREVARLKPLTRILRDLQEAVEDIYRALPPGAAETDYSAAVELAFDQFSEDFEDWLTGARNEAIEQAVEDTAKAMRRADVVMEHRPGGKEHNQLDHGRKKGGGGGDWDSPDDEMSDMPGAQAAAVKEFMAANGIDHEQAVEQVLSLYNSAASKSTKAYNGKDQTAAEAGKGFYENHDLDQRAESLGVSEEVMIGTVAALSPMTAWETRKGMPNLERAEKVIRIQNEDPVMNITPEVISEWHERPVKSGSRIDLGPYAGERRMSELPTGVVARLANADQFRGSGSNAGWHPADKAVRLYRGDRITDVLGNSAPKTRAFSNAFASRGKGPTPVIDRHIVRAIANRRDIGESGYSHLIDGPNRPPRQGWKEKAGYNFMSSVLTEGARRAGVNVHDFQAAVWYSWLASNP